MFLCAIVNLIQDIEEEFSLFQSKFLRFVCIMVLCSFLTSISVVQAVSVEDKRQKVRNMSDATLEKLYEVHPSARRAIQNAAGYAVFKNTGVKIFVLGSGMGKGIAVNQVTGEETFMKMAEAQVGLGLGVKEFNVIFVFATEDALDKFINTGWEFGGQATAAITDGVSGDSMQGAVTVSRDTWMYQMTEKGLALELTGKGTRYYKDSELNKK